MRYRVDSGEKRGRTLPRIARWQLWQLGVPALSFLLATEAAALLLTGVALGREQLSLTDVARVTVLLLGAVLYGEASDRVERLRRYLGDGKVRTNHLSLWTIAAALLVPPGLACALVLAVYAHVMVLGWRKRSIRPHRMLFTAAAATLATWAAAQTAQVVAHSVLPVAGVGVALASVAALVVFFALDVGIVGTGVYLAARPPRFTAVLPDRESVAFDATTQVLGVVTAQLLLHTPWLAPAILGCLVAVHRASLVKQLQVAATTDPKTMLLNAAAWRERAQEVLGRACREHQRVALILIDLDHFKRVNDEHGHLVGDRVLREVGALLKRESRGHDIVGRFGGEEFVILIDGHAAAAHAVDVATRLRERIAAVEFGDGLRVTATLGVAHQIPSSDDLDAIIGAADAALYQGKAAGRDRVHAVALA